MLTDVYMSDEECDAIIFSREKVTEGLKAIGLLGSDKPIIGRVNLTLMQLNAMTFDVGEGISV